VAARAIDLRPAALLLAVGIAIGFAGGLAARSARTAEPDPTSISGASTHADEAPPGRRATAPTAFPPVTTSPVSQPPVSQPPVALAPPAPASVTHAAVRASLAEVARVDAPLADALEQLLAAARAPDLPLGTTRGAVTGTVTREGGAPLEGVRLFARPLLAAEHRSLLPWSDEAELERDLALEALATLLLEARIDAAWGGAAASGPDGAFEVAGLPPGAYLFEAALPGHVFHRPDDLEPDPSSPGERVDLVARPARPLTVRVSDAAGRAAKGAHLAVYAGGRRISAGCDGRGVASIDVAAGRAQIFAERYTRPRERERAEVNVETAALGPPAIADVRLAPVEAPDASGGGAGPPPPPRGALLVRLRDPRGLPVTRRRVALLAEGRWGRKEAATAETDVAGAALLTVPARVPEESDAGPETLLLAVGTAGSYEPYLLDPAPVTSLGARDLVVPDPAVLLVTTPPALRAAYGGRITVEVLAGVGDAARPLDTSGGGESLPSDRPLVLGPFAAGACALRVHEVRHEDHSVPLATVALDLPPGVTTIALPPPATRGVRVRVPGFGHVIVVEDGPGGPRITTWKAEVARGRLDLPHVAGRALVVCFVPEGDTVVRACALVPAGAPGDWGEVAPRPDGGRGLRAAVLSTPPRDLEPAPPDLRAGDVLLAVDGAPVADALRPFGDRLAPSLPEAPIRLTIDRAGRVLEVEATPASLRAAIAEETALVGPAPPAE